MADYYPLLARALDGLSDPDDAARQAVYDRARNALGAQLDSISPPLPDAEVARERASLEDAIMRAEFAFGAPDPGVRFASGGSSGRTEPRGRAGSGPGPAVAAERPPRRRVRKLRRALTVITLILIVAPIAFAAWLWRDQPFTMAVPEALRPAATSPPAPSEDPKFAERVGGGGEAARPGRTAAAERTPSEKAAPAPRASAPERPVGGSSTASDAIASQSQPEPSGGSAEVAVAQRAALIEENATNQQQPKVTPGRVIWRLDNVNAGQGQPLETVVRATVDIADAGLTLQIVVRKNADPTFPASHTMLLTFTTNPSAGGPRTVRDVGLPQVRPDDSVRGVPVAGVSVPVKENVFLIGLSGLRSDIDLNTDLLLHRNWIELPLRFSSGQRAALVFEKGVSGDRVFADAFRQWGAS